MLRLAVANLLRRRARFLGAAGGVALSLTLILALGAIVDGARSQISSYIDHSGADLIVSQRGVRTMHMSTSSLSAETLATVAATPGVDRVTPVQLVTTSMTTGSDTSLVYAIGIAADATMGVPWEIEAGARRPGRGEVLIDAAIASGMGLRLGDRVGIFGRDFTVAGLTHGTVSIVNSVAFMTDADLRAATGSAAAASYAFVSVAEREDAETVGARIRAALPEVTVQAREEFARQERQLVSDMSADLITIMNLAGVTIGLAVMALTVYTATLSRLREFGVLKALGAGNRVLWGVVVSQATLSVVASLLGGVVLTLALQLLAPVAAPTLALRLTAGLVAQTLGLSLAIAAVASLLPIWQIAGLDPASVYRRGGGT